MDLTDSEMHRASDRGGWTDGRPQLSAEAPASLVALIPPDGWSMCNGFACFLNEQLANTVADWCKRFEFQATFPKRKRKRGRAASAHAASTPKLVTLVRKERKNLRLPIAWEDQRALLEKG